MTYAFITEWMDKEAVDKFDRDLVEDPAAAARRQALDGHRQLMQVFGMAAAG